MTTMTKQEARAIATAMNAWRRCMYAIPMPCTPGEFGQALDLLTQPSTIAESIRNAAINWPQFLGDVESEIIHAFCEVMDWPKFDSIVGRTFMLFVAEALES